MLKFRDEPSMLFFSDLKILIADEVALKQSLESKGAAGKLFCCRCSNAVAKGSFDSMSRTEGLVRGTSTDFDQFRLHTNATVQRIVNHLSEQHNVLNQVEFARLETALGWNWRPGGLLTSESYGHQIPESVMFDWFHIFLVHGVANREFGLLSASLRDSGIPDGRLDNFISSFTWPKQFGGSRPQNIFAKRDTKGEPLKCSASELLSAYPIIRAFLVNFVWEQVPAARRACSCSLKLCAVLDLLMTLNRGGSVGPSELHTAIKEYLDCFLQTHGDEFWVPKCHMSLHLGEFLERFGCLLSCFCHERKHRLVKRFGDPVCNFNQSFEKSILADIIHVQLLDLRQDTFHVGVSLVNEKVASVDLARLALRGDGEVKTSWVAQAKDGQMVHKDDVVEFSEGVGQVMCHLRQGAMILTVLRPWDHIHGQMYKVKDVPIVIETKEVKTCCMYSLKGEDAMVVRR